MAGNERDFIRVYLAPERVLAILRKMPGVISAKFRDGKFFARTPSGTAEIKFFFPKKENEGTA